MLRVQVRYTSCKYRYYKLTKQFMQPHSYGGSEAGLKDRVAVLARIPDPIYAHGIAWLSEFLGTTFFLFLALSGEQVAFSAGSGEGAAVLLYACLSYAFAFTVSSWIFFRVTSGLWVGIIWVEVWLTCSRFNPAIALGMCFVESITWPRAIVVMVAQFLGAMTASGLVVAIFPGPLVPTMQLGAETSTARGFCKCPALHEALSNTLCTVIELFLTMCFILMVFMMASEKHKGAVRTLISNEAMTDLLQQVIVPIGLGLALFSVELGSILYTGGSLNPARAFAVALASHQWPSYHWIYWLAPFLGCIPASLLFRVIKGLEHETSVAQRRAVPEVATGHKQEVAPEAPHGNRLSAVPEHDVEKGEQAAVN